MAEYLQYAEANGRFPNIAGFCVFAKMNHDTYYSSGRLYPEAYKFVQDMLEDSVLSLNEKLTQRIALYLKNKFGYRETMEQTIKVPEPITVNYSKLSTEELIQMKALLDKANDGTPKD